MTYAVMEGQSYAKVNFKQLDIGGEDVACVC